MPLPQQGYHTRKSFFSFRGKKQRPPTHTADPADWGVYADMAEDVLGPGHEHVGFARLVHARLLKGPKLCLTGVISNNTDLRSLVHIGRPHVSADQVLCAPAIFGQANFYARLYWHTTGKVAGRVRAAHHLNRGVPSEWLVPAAHEDRRAWAGRVARAAAATPFDFPGLAKARPSAAAGYFEKLALLEWKEGERRRKKEEAERAARTVRFGDLLAACRVEDDDDNGPPWQEHDGYEHEAVPAHRLTEGTYNPDDVVGRAYDRHLIVVSREQAVEWYGEREKNYPGTHRQVYEEGLAECRRRGIDQIKHWYEHGYSWFGVVCDLSELGGRVAKDCADESILGDSLWGIQTENDDPDDPYFDRVKEEIADDVADELEKRGFTVTGRPDFGSRERKQDWLRWRIAHHLGFRTNEAYRAWVTGPPPGTPRPGRRRRRR